MIRGLFTLLLLSVTAAALAAVTDSDGDAIPDPLEGWPPLAGQTNRYLPDSDGDALSDGAEDADHNGQRDAGELDARDADTDNDQAEDGQEARVLFTDPRNPASPAVFSDADADGLDASVDPGPFSRDTDQDRYADGLEAAALGLLAVILADQHPTLGDFNRDTAVTNVDALIAQAVFLGLAAPTAWATGDGDPNRDGQVSNVDALLLQAFFLSLVAYQPLLAPDTPTPTLAPTASPTPTRTRTSTPTITPTTLATNLLRNPGFEEGESPTFPGVGKYWETNDAQAHPNICSLDTGIKHSGQAAQKLAANSTWDLGAVRQVSNYNTVQGGKTYELRGWCKTQDIGNPAGWYILGIWWFANDTWLADVKNERQETLNFDWRELVIRATAPANANRAAVFLTRHTDGTVWYDDLSLIRVD